MSIASCIFQRLMASPRRRSAIFAVVCGKRTVEVSTVGVLLFWHKASRLEWIRSRRLDSAWPAAPKIQQERQYSEMVATQRLRTMITFISPAYWDIFKHFGSYREFATRNETMRQKAFRIGDGAKHTHVQSAHKRPNASVRSVALRGLVTLDLVHENCTIRTLTTLKGTEIFFWGESNHRPIVLRLLQQSYGVTVIVLSCAIPAAIAKRIAGNVPAWYTGTERRKELMIIFFFRRSSDGQAGRDDLPSLVKSGLMPYFSLRHRKALHEKTSYLVEYK